MVEENKAEELTKAPRTISSRGRQDKVAEPAPVVAPAPAVVNDEPTKTRKSTREFISEGETFEVEVVVNEDGFEVTKESVYRTVGLPNSKRTTKRLIKAAGTRIY